jgi:hypothetical protein
MFETKVNFLSSIPHHLMIISDFFIGIPSIREKIKQENDPNVMYKGLFSIPSPSNYWNHIENFFSRCMQPKVYRDGSIETLSYPNLKSLWEFLSDLVSICPFLLNRLLPFFKKTFAPFITTLVNNILFKIEMISIPKKLFPSLFQAKIPSTKFFSKNCLGIWLFFIIMINKELTK